MSFYYSDGFITVKTRDTQKHWITINTIHQVNPITVLSQNSIITDQWNFKVKYCSHISESLGPATYQSNVKMYCINTRPEIICTGFLCSANIFFSLQIIIKCQQLDNQQGLFLIYKHDCRTERHTHKNKR